MLNKCIYACIKQWGEILVHKYLLIEIHFYAPVFSGDIYDTYPQICIMKNNGIYQYKVKDAPSDFRTSDSRLATKIQYVKVPGLCAKKSLKKTTHREIFVDSFLFILLISIKALEKTIKTIFGISCKLPTVMRKHFLFCFQMQQLQLLGEISVREITQPFRKIKTEINDLR